MVPLPRAATQPSIPTYNTIPAATEGYRATGVMRGLFAFATLNGTKGPASVAGQREQVISAFLRDFGPKLLPFCPHSAYRWHWPLGERKSRVFTGNPSFPQGWPLCCLCIFHLKDNKTFSRKMDLIFRNDKSSNQSGITDSKTFRRTWKLIFLQWCCSIQFLLFCC